MSLTTFVRQSATADEEAHHHYPLPGVLQAHLVRERFLRKKYQTSLNCQRVHILEIEHRIANSLQLISALLSTQSRKATTREAGLQLAGAACRIAALGRINRRLGLQEACDDVELLEFLTILCNDLQELLFPNGDRSIRVIGASTHAPHKLASALGVITNELIVNSTKHAVGDIEVRLERLHAGRHTLTVRDGGARENTHCDHTSGGLGKKLIASMASQVGAELSACAGVTGAGGCTTVTFDPSKLPEMLRA